MPDNSDFPIPVATDEAIAEFIAQYGKPYDPEAVLKETVDAQRYASAQRQCRIAST